MYKKEAEKELEILDSKLKQGYIKQEEYDNALVELAEKYYGKGSRYYGTEFAADEYKSLFDKSTDNDQSQYKEAFEKRLKELDKELEKGRITVKEYRSEYAKLREEWWGAGSKWHGTTFASEMYEEMSESLENVDELYDERLDALKEKNDNTLDAERTFVSDWISLNQKMYGATDPKKYKENLDEIKKYVEGLDDTLGTYLDKWSKVNSYDENSVQSRQAYLDEWKAVNAVNYGNIHSPLYNADAYKANLKEQAEYEAETYRLMLENGEIVYEKYAEKVNDIYERYKIDGEHLLDLSFVSERVSGKTQYDEFLEKAEKQTDKTAKSQESFLRSVSKEADTLKENGLLSISEYKEIYTDIADRYLEMYKDMLDKELIDYKSFETLINTLYKGIGDKNIDLGQGWLSDALDIDKYEYRLKELEKANDGSLESERKYISKWKALNKSKFKDIDNTKYIENIKSIAEYELDVLKGAYDKGLITAQEYFDGVTKALEDTENLGEKYVNEKLENAWSVRAESEKTYWQQQKDIISDYLDREIKKLEEVENEQEKINKNEKLRNELVKARQKLEDAKKQKNQLIFENGAFRYDYDQDEALDAQEAVKDALDDIRENELTEQINTLKEQKDNALQFYSDIISMIDGYINKTTQIAESDSEIFQAIASSVYAQYDRDMRNGNIAANTLTDGQKSAAGSKEEAVEAAEGAVSEQQTETEEIELQGFDIPEWVKNSQFGADIMAAASILANSDFARFVQSIGGNADKLALMSFAASAISSASPATTDIMKAAENVSGKSTVSAAGAMTAIINIGDVNITVQGGNADDIAENIAEKITNSIAKRLPQAIIGMKKR